MIAPSNAHKQHVMQTETPTTTPLFAAVGGAACPCPCEMCAKNTLNTPHTHTSPLGGGEGPRGYPCGGEMGSPSPPQAPMDFFFFARFFTCFHGNSAYLRPCYHALRHPFGAADRAMLLNGRCPSSACTLLTQCASQTASDWLLALSRLCLHSLARMGSQEGPRTFSGQHQCLSLGPANVVVSCHQCGTSAASRHRQL